MKDFEWFAFGVFFTIFAFGVSTLILNWIREITITRELRKRQQMFSDIFTDVIRAEKGAEK